MENVEVKQEIKNSDDGKGILITNDAIEQIANLLKGKIDKKSTKGRSKIWRL
jgi:iron-sulfur cluster assembly protein